MSSRNSFFARTAPQQLSTAQQQQQQHQPVPLMYDTSVSTNSASGSSSADHSSSMTPQKQQQQQQQQSFYNHHPFRTTQQQQQYYAHSEPGVIESNLLLQQQQNGIPHHHHDRFAAYVNRFAELDPRMDHRSRIIQEEEQEQVITTSGEPANNNKIGITAAAFQAAMKSSNQYTTTTTTTTTPTTTKQQQQQQQYYGTTTTVQDLVSSTSSSAFITPHQPIDTQSEIITNNYNNNNDESPTFMYSSTRVAANLSRTKELLRKSKEYRTRKKQILELQQQQKMMNNNNNNISNETEKTINPYGDETTSHLSPYITQYGRAEIETPQPAHVPELRKKLWSPEERLLVASSPLRRPAVVRSLSPISHRKSLFLSVDNGTSTNNNNVAPTPTTTGNRPFKSKFYEAAMGLQQQASSSPPPPLPLHADAYVDGDNHIKKYWSTKRNDNYCSSDDNRQQQQQQQVPNIVADDDDNNNNIHKRIEDSDNNNAGGDDYDDDVYKRTEETIESLIARLGKVNRDDPHAALAEIDAILRQRDSSQCSSSHNSSNNKQKQSQKMEKNQEQKQDEHQDADEEIKKKNKDFSQHQREVKYSNNDESNENENDDEDYNDDDDQSTSSDETSVSSITNPTYLEQVSKIEQVSMSNNNTGKSSGQPRPSSLTAYQQPNKLKKKAPPVNIHVVPNNSKNKSSVSNKNDKHLYNNIENIILETPTKTDDDNNNTKETSASNEKEKQQQQHRQQQKLKKKKLDNHINIKKEPSGDMASTNSAEIEEKIKKWDELSTGIIPNKHNNKNISATEEAQSAATTDLGSLLTSNNNSDSAIKQSADHLRDVRNNRSHPWDASIPVRMGKINVKDTSMDAGDGIETQYTPKYLLQAVTSPDRSGIAPVRRMRKERLATRRSSTSTGSNSNGESRQQQTAKTLSDEFDTAWVNLPTSKFFSNGKSSNNNTNTNNTTNDTTSTNYDVLESKRRQQQKQQQNLLENEKNYNHLKSSKGIQHHQPLHRELLTSDNSAEYITEGGVEVQYNEKRNHYIDEKKTQEMDDNKLLHQSKLYQTFMAKTTVDDDEPELPHYAPLGAVAEARPRAGSFDESYHRSHSMDDVNAILATSSSSLEKKSSSKRGLRGFLKRNKQQVAGARSVISSDQITQSHQSTTSSASTRNLYSISDRMSTGEVSRNVGGRSRRQQSKSPARTRSHSLDERRIKNPNIARKFSRLLRVYDEGKDLNKTNN